jgi:hypothetical protein
LNIGITRHHRFRFAGAWEGKKRTGESDRGGKRNTLTDALDSTPVQIAAHPSMVGIYDNFFLQLN